MKNIEEKPGLYEIEKKNGQYFVNNSKNEQKQIPTNFYDVIVKINSIKGIKKGWPIYISEKGKKNYELYKNKTILKI